VVGQTVIGGQPMPVLRFMGFPPNGDASGDIESMDLLAGQGVGLVREIMPAGQIVRELVEEARQIVSQRLAGLMATRTDRGRITAFHGRLSRRHRQVSLGSDQP
jgi:hypothetical protein